MKASVQLVLNLEFRERSIPVRKPRPLEIPKRLEQVQQQQPPLRLLIRDQNSESEIASTQENSKVKDECPTRAHKHLDADQFVAAFAGQMAAANYAPKAARDYLQQVRRVLEIASELLVRTATTVDLFSEPALLGRCLVDDRKKAGGTLSKWSLDQRRHAWFCFSRLIAPELRSTIGREPEDIVCEALRGVAEQVGGTYRLKAGNERRRGGYVPTTLELQGVIAEAARERGFAGSRNAAFFSILAGTAARVNALRELDGRDVYELPNGVYRLLLHAKGSPGKREVELVGGKAEAFRQYVDRFNSLSAFHGRSERIGSQLPGPVWRSTNWRSPWSYASVRATFVAACGASAAHSMRLHCLRRYYATEGSSYEERYVVALAGGWDGTERMDMHYVSARSGNIERKLRAGQRGSEGTKVLAGTAL